MEEKKENSKSRFLMFLNSVGVPGYKCAQMCGWASGYLTGLKGDFGADKLATLALTKGVQFKAVSKMLGHSSLKTTEEYAAILNKDVDKGYEMFEKQISG